MLLDEYNVSINATDKFGETYIRTYMMTIIYMSKSGPNMETTVKIIT